jgi:tetratricopeptide (TPR) repeat protein
MPDDLEKMFNEVVNAARQGQRARAKDLLSRLLRADQGNAEYWVWMSAMVDSATERQYCLQQALKVDPNHATARRALIMVGALPADNVSPVPPPRRKWSPAADVQAAETPKNGLARLWQKLPPIFRTRPVVIGFVGIVVFLCIGIGGCLIGALLQPRDYLPVGAHTVAPMTPVWDTNTPTPSPTFTVTPATRTATPTLSGATPLVALLKATYTPMPRYVATPHGISEAYRSGLVAYDRGQYDKMLLNMQQAGTEMPFEVDVAYYRAEALRNLARLDEALDVYDQIIEVNPTFAPAYLGRALTRWAQQDIAEAGDDFAQAIELDPNFVDAPLQRAAYRLSLGEYEGALEDLQIVEGLNPDHPLLYLLRAEIYLLTGEKEPAIENAQRAYEMDRTFLPAYLALGRAYLANEQPQEAYQFVHDYLAYEKQDPQGFLTMGQVYYQLGKNYPAALKSFDQALELDDKLAEAYHYRGLTYLALDDAKSAVNDLVKAVNLSPKSFTMQLDLGIALFAAERSTEAVNQLASALRQAETDTQFAAVYHWRAQIYQAAGNLPAAIREWESLLALPEKNIPSDWYKQAKQSLLALTPTPEVTSTATASPTPDQTITPTTHVTATP